MDYLSELKEAKLQALKEKYQGFAALTYDGLLAEADYAKYKLERARVFEWYAQELEKTVKEA